MKQLAYILFIGAIIFVGCEKQEFPEQTVSDPSFHFHGTVNDENIDLVPGTNDYYMFTWDDDHDEHRMLHSEIAKASCEDCGPFLSFSFSIEEDEELEETGEIEIIEADWITDGSLLLYADNYPEGTTFSWSLFGGIEISNDPFLEIEDADISPIITLLINGGTECEEVLVWPVIAFDPCLGNLCIQPFNYEWIDATTLEIFPGESAGENGLYQWSLEVEPQISGIESANVESFIIELPEAINVNTEFNLTFIGDFCNSTFLRSISPFSSGCSGTAINNEFLPDIDTSGLIVEYQDEDGNFYSTHLECSGTLLEQPSDSFFEIDFTEEFGLNEHGDEINRISISGKLDLFSEENLFESITLEFEDALIAVPK